MSSPVSDWDLPRYRDVLRARAARLRADPRVRVRFDESDLTNETLLRALSTEAVPEGLTTPEQQLAWLAVIQDHKLLDMQEKEFADKRDVRREQDVEALRQALCESSVDQAAFAVDTSAPPPEKAERREMAQLTDEAIDQLASPRREIFRLRKDEGLTLDEIAARLGLAATVVSGHYRRGLKQLQEQLDRERRS